MTIDFNLLELVAYSSAWAIVGGIPGFYLANSLNRNPRHGARLGVVAGVLVGMIGLLSGLISTPADLINAVALLWLAALLAGIALGATHFGHGNYARQTTLRQRMADLAYGLLLPTLLIVAVIVIFPMIWNSVLAFRPIRLRDLPDLRLFSLDDVSLDNFDRVISTRGFGDTLLRTFIYTIFGTTLAIIMGLIAALIMRDTFRGRGVVRGLMLFPYVAPVISVALIWKMLFNAQYGLINEIIVGAGGRRTDFLFAPATAFTMVIFFQAWRYFPFAYLFLLARIQAIPDDLYEAAKVDGAAPSQRLWYVTLPQLRAVFGTLFLLRFIWTFNKFDDVFLLTGGSAGTKLISIEVYDQLFSSRNVGTAAAVAVILAIILMVVAMIYFRWFMTEEA